MKETLTTSFGFLLHVFTPLDLRQAFVLCDRTSPGHGPNTRREVESPWSVRGSRGLEITSSSSSCRVSRLARNWRRFSRGAREDAFSANTSTHPAPRLSLTQSVMSNSRAICRFKSDETLTFRVLVMKTYSWRKS